ncbi:MAG TPA: hypothetical protein VGH93_02990, partial [Solirubrobacteraceae bacterium]
MKITPIDERDDYGAHPVLAATGGEAVTPHALLGAGDRGQARGVRIRRAVQAGPVTGLVSQVLLL